MDHLLGVVFGLLSPKKALDHNMYVVPEDFIMETDKTLDNLKYCNNNNALVTMPPGTSGLLKSFKHFVAYQVSHGAIIDKDDWLTIAQKECNNFWISSTNNISLIVAAPVTLSNICPPPIVDLVKEFKCGIKHNTTQFPTFKDNVAWDNWNWSTIAQA